MALSTTRVTNVDGEIIALTRDGVRTFLLPDPQGNVVGEIDSAHQVVNRTSYWPNGEVRTGTGYPFGYGGTLGYHRHRHVLGAWTDPRMYVRARWLDPVNARWLTVDPLWPSERAYAYVNANPTTWVDPSGLITLRVQLCAFIGGWRAAPGKRPYMYVDPLIGVNTNDRSFGQDPLSCKLFAETTIDSCSIGDVAPSTPTVNTGRTRWVKMSSLELLAAGTATPSITVYLRSVSDCRSTIAFEVSASA